ncbi:MAG: hypothetical protein H7Y11_00595 [Armatimonadetes bacterium]|nr:hypothetical protein [Anaerolineae bacterium]
MAALNMVRHLNGESGWILPNTTMLGALCHYVTHAEPKHFQPMKANFGILPALSERVKGKRDRYSSYADRALDDLAESITSLHDDRLPAVSLIAPQPS